MDDECCVMEEKSLIGCFRNARNSVIDEADGLSEKPRNESPPESINWLPDQLKKEIACSFEKIGQKTNFPVVDWLKEIRSSCDLYDVGLPSIVASDRDLQTDRKCRWSSSEESDDSCSEIPENLSLDRNIDHEINRKSFSDTNDRDSSDSGTETNRQELESPVTQTEDATARTKPMTQSNDRNSWKRDKNYHQPQSLVSSESPEKNWPICTSRANDFPIFWHHFRSRSKSSEFFMDNDRFLPDFVFCLDDDRALARCDHFLIQESENSSHREPDLVDLLRTDFSDDNLSQVEDSSLPSNLEDSGSTQGQEIDLQSDELSSDQDIEPIFRWIDQFASSDSLDRINPWLDKKSSSLDRFDGIVDLFDHEKSTQLIALADDRDLANKNYMINDLRWCANFDRLNPLDETFLANEISLDTFNIFDPSNDSDTNENSIPSLGHNSNDNSFECLSNFHAGDVAQNLNQVIEKIELIQEFRCRKGSASSDIVAWKRFLLDDYLDEDECEDQWFSSSDAEGKIYFFEENSNESSWVLPPVGSAKSHSNSVDEKKEKVDLDRSTSDKEETGSARSNAQPNQSMGSRELLPKKTAPIGGDWPHLCDGNNMLVLKEGVINRTKITENGKKLRKNWSTSYAVLTELFLLFFKDSKTFTMMKTGQSSMAKPDISVDLNGALVEPGERASSRKNVYMISTVLGLQVLVQSENTAVATEWFQEIHAAIRKLPSSFKSQGKALPVTTEIRKTSGGKQPAEINHQEDTKKSTKIARSRSMKMKRLDDSLEDLSGSAAERQTKIKAKLRRFFLRRPAVELLVKNGIYKDEPAFGSYLSDVCPPEPPRVPIFVKTCIEVLESNEENMKTDGLYRASGNLSQIQKIRLQVDQYKLDVLAQEEDVHVLAGALKLFFRELKEPLIPSTFFKEAVNASMLKKNSAKIQCFREIVKALPAPNYDTLQFLLKHLLRVTSYQEFNRMHIPNLAIVFGPTLMWPAEESANMALDFMQQNLVIECLLSEYNKIFK